MSTAEEIKSRAQSLLAPISESEPAGTNAAYDPRFESLRNDMVALDSPTGGEVDWSNIEKRGRELLTSVSKDLLVASYTGYAMFEVGGLSGLATAIQLVTGLYNGYWDTCFPPIKRLRGRGNALDWLVARLEIKLPQLEVRPEERAAFDLVVEAWQGLAQIARDRLDDAAPSMRGVSEALERIRLSLPAAPAPAAQPVDATPEPSVTAQPAATAPAAASPGPATATAQAPGEPAPAPAANEAPAPAEATPEIAAAPEDPLAAAEQEADAWLQPIDGGAGEDARYDTAFEEARAEVGKLEALTGDQPDWAVVAKRARSILESRSKDVLMACYLAVARFQLDGLGALPTGLMVVHGIFDRFFEAAFPTRARGRANAVAWMVAQLDLGLEGCKLTSDDRQRVQTLSAAVDRFTGIVREKMGSDAPSMGDLTQRVQRMLLAIPEPAPKEPPKPPPPQPAAAPAPAAPAPAAAAPGGPAPTLAQPMPTVAAGASSPEEVTKFLQETGRALVTAANVLRRAQLGSATAYRLLRIGLWLHLENPPPSGPGGKTQIPPLPPPRRQQLDLLAQNAKWEALIEECESSLGQFRFNLDLQRWTCEALEKLGDAYAPARRAAMAEIASLLARMPGLPDLVSADGSPLADDGTRRWLQTEVLASGEGASSGDDGEEGEVLGEIRTLMKGPQATEALKAAQALLHGADSQRRRFVRRLTLAEACLEARQAILARGMFASLDRELQAHELLAWEPSLASRCLEGLLRSIRAASKDGAQHDGADAVFERLCAVDPSAAARLSGSAPSGK
jgi:type VI secretion system ImpA/VasJ family protein